MGLKPPQSAPTAPYRAKHVVGLSHLMFDDLCHRGPTLSTGVATGIICANSLISFLSKANNTFVCIDIVGDVEKLLEDYYLRVANFIGLRCLAMNVFGDPQIRNVGLKALVECVLNQMVKKPHRITLSKLDNQMEPGTLAIVCY